MSRPGCNLLGVVVTPSKTNIPPFHEPIYSRQLSQVGRDLGIRVIVFYPTNINWKNREVKAWHYDHRWQSDSFPLPTVLYDRCHYESGTYHQFKPYMEKLEKYSRVTLLGRALGGKLSTYEMLTKNSRLTPFLSPTVRYTSPNDVLNAINQSGSVIIKPNGGSHGKGVAAIHPKSGYLTVKGRSPSNDSFLHRIHSKQAFSRWVTRFVGKTNYLVQPFLELTTADGRPFDLRMLVQKDKHGNWQTTGMAIRCGAPHSLTSNLHGGGHAERAIPFLKRNFPDHQDQICSALEMLSKEVPTEIEHQHGRLVELGLDIGIDRKGHVWLLEVNSKPGRSVFNLTGEKSICTRAIRQPILYAQTLLQQGIMGGSV